MLLIANQVFLASFLFEFFDIDVVLLLDSLVGESLTGYLLFFVQILYYFLLHYVIHLKREDWTRSESHPFLFIFYLFFSVLSLPVLYFISHK